MNFFSRTLIKIMATIPKKEQPVTTLIIDWSDPKSKLSKYFTVGDALLLHKWNAYHKPSEEEKINILKIAETMDKIRELINLPITVSCWIRPKVANIPEHVQNGKDYNSLVGGAKASAHIYGKAVDWTTKATCDEIRARLLPHLDALGVCVEDLPGSNWIHCDSLLPRLNGGRFFKP